MIIWYTGLSGSGKSTLALKMQATCYVENHLIDGDTFRGGLCDDLGYSIPDRKENIRRLTHIAKFLDEQSVVQVAAITPTIAMRNMIRSITNGNIMFVHVDAPLSVCEKRDVKGLYKQAREGKIKNFTGIDSVYEIPTGLDVFKVSTVDMSIDASSLLVLEEYIKRSNKK